MKITSLILSLQLVFLCHGSRATEEPLQYIGYSSHTNSHKIPSHNLSKTPMSDMPEEHSLPAQHTHAKIVDTALKGGKSNDSLLLELAQQHHKKGLSYFEAFLKAQQELEKAKEPPLESELHSLGCVHWSEIKEITPHIFETVKAFYKPEKGPFILKPGLTIVYLNED